MTNRIGFIRLLAMGWVLWASYTAASVWADANTIKEYTEVKLSAEYALYDTELFNLLINQKNIIDGKNHFEKNFSNSFDALLSQSSSAQSKQSLDQLKKRLLSGPADKPQVLKNNTTGVIYLYYEACQAHACDETSLGLLYETHAKTMVGRLLIKGKESYLGYISESEKNLIKTLANNSVR